MIISLSHAYQQQHATHTHHANVVQTGSSRRQTHTKKTLTLFFQTKKVPSLTRKGPNLPVNILHHHFCTKSSRNMQQSSPMQATNPQKFQTPLPKKKMYQNTVAVRFFLKKCRET